MHKISGVEGSAFVSRLVNPKQADQCGASELELSRLGARLHH